MAEAEQTALVVGASRGLGLALAQTFAARGWRVIATAREASSAALTKAAAESDGRIEVEQLDITDAGQIAALRQRLDGRTLDLLFVNAGVLDQPVKPIGEVADAEFVRLMTTNALGPLRVIDALADLVTPEGTIGAMSSGLGSVGGNVSGGYEAYRASKAALNTLMRSFAARDGKSRRTVLVMDPGWVRTDMGGPDAQLGVEESIPRLVDVMLQQSGKGGAHYLDYRGRTVQW